MTQELKIMIIVGIVTVSLLVGGVFLLSSQNTNNANADQIDSSKLVRSWSHQTATDSADKKITIVEFADFQCPACAAAYPVIQRVKEEYKEDLNFVYRHFPLMQHRYGKISAKAAEAAGEQGKFWEMYSKLYLTQDQWGNSSNPEADFERFANELGLDINKFKSDLSSDEISDRINKDVSDALDLNVNSTPTLFINGERIAGAPQYEQLKSKIETLLNK